MAGRGRRILNAAFVASFKTHSEGVRVMEEIKTWV
jgi:hypothetical protein